MSLATGLVNDEVWRNHLFTGSWQAPLAGGLIEVREPATGELLVAVGAADASDVEASAREAAEVQPGWAASAPQERADVFREAARLVRRHSREIRERLVRETGSIHPKIDIEVRSVEAVLQQAAAMLSDPQGLVLSTANDRLSLSRRVPHGVVGVISPFTFPFSASMRVVAPALAAGNAVVLKPDPRTPVAGGLILARLFEEAHLPSGLLHVVPGGAETGEALCSDPSIAMIAFSGSSETARRVGALAGQHLKKVQLSLGGNNALVILEDADLDVAASNARWGAWLHQGQAALSTGRILVHEAIAPAIVERLVWVANQLPVGNPAREQVALGPLISEAHRVRVQQLVDETVASGARLRAGGTSEGLFYRPTVLEGVTPGMRAFEEEVLGPVASVTTFGSDEEAVALANRTAYGQSAGVISSSVRRALMLGNQLRCGILHINDQTLGDEPGAPVGAGGQSGNGSRGGGVANWEEFTRWQWMTVQGAAMPYPL